MERSETLPAPIELAALGIMLAIAVIPFWTLHYLPTTDGAAHLANADIVLHFLRGDAAVYKPYYLINPKPVPNWLGHALLAVLMLATPPLIAEKIFFSAYLILLPLSVRYAIRGVRKSAGFLALLAVPLSLNWITQQGFYNFSASVVVFFFALGYWLRHREQMNLWRVLLLMLLGFVLYAGHLSSIIIFALTIFILAIWFTLVRWRNLTWPIVSSPSPPAQPQINYAHPTPQPFRSITLTTLLRDFVSRGILSGLALLPAVALAFWFQHRGFEGKPHGLKLAIRDAQYWKDLLELTFLISYRAHWEKWLARLTALLLGVTLIYVLADKFRHRRWTSRDGFIFIPLALVGIYFLQGDQAQRELFIPRRLLYYTCLTYLLFLAAQHFDRWMRTTIIAASMLLTIGFTAVHLRPMRQYDQQISEYVVAGDQMPKGQTVLPLIFAPRGIPLVSDFRGLRVTPFFSVDEYFAIDRNAIDLRNYEAMVDYFPVRYRPELNPRNYLAIPGTLGLMDVPQKVDISHYQQVGGRVDNVLIWGLASLPQDKWDPATRDTLQYVHTHYRLAYRSPSGNAELWHWMGK